jgi:P27 family predicted phage terminase small subunit
MGRHAKPAAVKEAQGNPGRRPIVSEGAASPVSAFDAPRGLKAGPRKVWDALAPTLAQLRFLRPSDLTAFRRYCVFIYKWSQIEPDLIGAKATVTTVSQHNPDGLERKSATLLVALMLDKRLSEIEDRFGMNPAARQRLLLQMAQQGALPLGEHGRQTVRTESDVPGAEAPTLDLKPRPESPVGLLN